MLVVGNQLQMSVFRGIVKFEEEYNVKHTVDEKLFKAQLDVWNTENLVIKNELKKVVRGTDDYIRLKNELIEHGLSSHQKKA
jgi:CRISPR/Cas system-associated endoribonuclease Cas2